MGRVFCLRSPERESGRLGRRARRCAMNGLFWVKLYLLTIPVFFAIDMVWLGVIARNLYKEQLHSLLSR